MSVLFFFNDTATTEIYTLSLHDALPIYELGRRRQGKGGSLLSVRVRRPSHRGHARTERRLRSEEHTSELQSRRYLVCRLLLEKKKTAYLTSYWNGYLKRAARVGWVLSEP